jgi:hypothetical protein
MGGNTRHSRSQGGRSPGGVGIAVQSYRDAGKNGNPVGGRSQTSSCAAGPTSGAAASGTCLARGRRPVQGLASWNSCFQACPATRPTARHGCKEACFARAPFRAAQGAAPRGPRAVPARSPRGPSPPPRRRPHARFTAGLRHTARWGGVPSHGFVIAPGSGRVPAGRAAASRKMPIQFTARIGGRTRRCRRGLAAANRGPRSGVH